MLCPTCIDRTIEQCQQQQQHEKMLMLVLYQPSVNARAPCPPLKRLYSMNSGSESVVMKYSAGGALEHGAIDLALHRILGVSCAQGGIAVLPTGALVTVVGGGILISDSSGSQSLLPAAALSVGVISALSLSPSGRHIAAGMAPRGDITIWRLESGSDAKYVPMGVFLEHERAISSLGFTHDDRLLVSVSTGAGGSFVVQDVAWQGAVVARASMPSLLSIACSSRMVADHKGRPTGLYAVAAAGLAGSALLVAIDPIDGTVARDALAMGGSVRSGTSSGSSLAPDYTSVAWSPDCRHLYVGSTTGVLNVVTVRTRSLRCSITLTGGGITCLCPLQEPALAQQAGAVRLWLGTTDGAVAIVSHATAGDEPEDDEQVPAAVLPLVVEHCARLRGPTWGLCRRRGKGTGGEDGKAAYAATASGHVVVLTMAHSTSLRTAATAATECERRSGSWDIDVAVISSAAGAAGPGGPDGTAPTAADEAYCTPLALGGVTGLPRPYYDRSRIGAVTAVAYASPDGGRSDTDLSAVFATASADNAVRVWDSSTGECLFMAASDARAGHPTCVAFGGSGDIVVAGFEDGGLRAWAVDTAVGRSAGVASPRAAARATQRAGVTYATSTASEARGRLTAARLDGRAPTPALWSIPTAHVVARGAPSSVTALGGCIAMRDAGGVTCLVAAANGRVLVSAGGDGVVRLWNASSRALLLQVTEHTGPVLGLAVIARGTCVASSGRDGVLNCWRIDDGALVSRHERPMGWLSGIAAVATQGLCVDNCCDSDGGDAVAAATSDGGIIMCRLNNSSSSSSNMSSVLPKAAAEANLALPRAEGFRRYGTCIAAARMRPIAATGDAYGRVVITCLLSGAVIASPPVAHTLAVAAIAFSPDERQLVSTGRDGSIVLWDVFTA